MVQMNALAKRDVYIVDGSRTPFIKARNQRGPFSAADLAVYACRDLLLRQPFVASDIQQVIAGCVMPSPEEANIARIISLRLGCGYHVPGWTVQRNCASGMQALDSAALEIATGRADLILAGGTEAMSHAPLLLNAAMTDWIGAWRSAKGISAKLQALAQFRPKYLLPIAALLRGLTDPIVNLNMGQTAEIIADRFAVTQSDMDHYAMASHQRLAKAIEEGYLKEIAPLYDKKGNVYWEDDGLRRDVSLEKLASLKPVFDKPFGKITAGNSSQITDGAAFVILASRDAVKRYGLPVLGKIIATEWVSLDPKQMGLGPVHAASRLLRNVGKSFDSIDYWEINEAFAGQVLACIRAWQDNDYCREQLGLEKSLGTIDLEKLNVDGGAVALGHPIGASGARIVLHLLHVLRRHQARYGIATLCIGGGQGGAMLLKHMEEADDE